MQGIALMRYSRWLMIYNSCGIDDMHADGVMIYKACALMIYTPMA